MTHINLKCINFDHEQVSGLLWTMSKPAFEADRTFIFFNFFFQSLHWAFIVYKGVSKWGDQSWIKFWHLVGLKIAYTSFLESFLKLVVKSTDFVYCGWPYYCVMECHGAYVGKNQTQSFLASSSILGSYEEEALIHGQYFVIACSLCMILTFVRICFPFIEYIVNPFAIFLYFFLNHSRHWNMSSYDMIQLEQLLISSNSSLHLTEATRTGYFNLLS